MTRTGAGCRSGWIAMLLLTGAGACGGGGGTGEKPPVFTPVSVTSQGNVFTLTLGDLKMVVDGGWGARVTEFSLKGKNVLVTMDENINFGTTFWPSPQASWCTAVDSCWPPPESVDQGVYSGGVEAATNVLALASADQTLEGIVGATIAVAKQFTPVPDSGAIDVTYTIANHSATDSVALAPWQVSRVEAGGLTFFAKGTGPVTYAPLTASTFMVNEMGGNLWYQSAPVTHDSKAFADGTGWIAHATQDRLFLLLAYPDTEPVEAAPGEGEIELYTNSSYVEVEAQGALTTIAPGDELSWTVRWKLRPVPAGTAVTAGSTGLAALANAVLAE